MKEWQWPKTFITIFGMDTLPHIENYDGNLLFVMLEDTTTIYYKFTLN